MPRKIGNFTVEPHNKLSWRDITNSLRGENQDPLALRMDNLVKGENADPILKELYASGRLYVGWAHFKSGSDLLRQKKLNIAEDHPYSEQSEFALAIKEALEGLEERQRGNEVSRRYALGLLSSLDESSGFRGVSVELFPLLIKSDSSAVDRIDYFSTRENLIKLCPRNFSQCQEIEDRDAGWHVVFVHEATHAVDKILCDYLSEREIGQLLLQTYKVQYDASRGVEFASKVFDVPGYYEVNKKVLLEDAKNRNGIDTSAGEFVAYFSERMFRTFRKARSISSFQRKFDDYLQNTAEDLSSIQPKHKRFVYQLMANCFNECAAALPEKTIAENKNLKTCLVHMQGKIEERLIAEGVMQERSQTIARSNTANIPRESNNQRIASQSSVNELLNEEEWRGDISSPKEHSNLKKAIDQARKVGGLDDVKIGNNGRSTTSATPPPVSRQKQRQRSNSDSLIQTKKEGNGVTPY